MPKCGYHPRMGDGLREFAAGLVDAVQSKAASLSRSVPEQLSCEADEFALVRTVVSEAIEQCLDQDSRADLEAFQALLVLGEYFLELRGGVHSAELDTAISTRLDRFISIMKGFDEVWKYQFPNRAIIQRARHAIKLTFNTAV